MLKSNIRAPKQTLGRHTTKHISYIAQAEQ